MIKQSAITIGFSSHRIEVIPFAKRLMESHDVIMTEEARMEYERLRQLINLPLPNVKRFTEK
jgi:hypothetical protein